jgi:hypothetical protein
LKLQDQGLLSPDEIESSNCPVCNSVLVFTRNANDEYYTTHCDRDITLNFIKYQATITKNKCGKG